LHGGNEEVGEALDLPAGALPVAKLIDAVVLGAGCWMLGICRRGVEVVAEVELDPVVTEGADGALDGVDFAGSDVLGG
jgi:hypothetical protein